MSDPTFRELMNCNAGPDEREWVKGDRATYKDGTTASLAEVARIVFTDESDDDKE